jgi:glycosyltransferase involved in cell wall biosynthesis
VVSPPARQRTLLIDSRIIDIMRVLIDCTGITRNKAGVGVYAKNLVDELTRLPDGPRYFLLVQDDDPELDFSSRPNVTMIRVRAGLFRRLPIRFLLEQLVLPCLLLIHRIDVVHSLHYSFPLVRFGTKQVVTVHDMTFFNMPQAHERVKVLYFRFFIRADVRFADKVLFDSHSTKTDCTARLGAPRGTSAVVHLGKSEAFRSDLAPGEIRRIRDKYGLNAEFILSVGTIEPRKNLSRLVSAFAAICDKHPGLLLVIAGMKGWMYDDLMATVRELKVESRVIFTGFVPEEDKPYLIAAAKVFAYPSLYEGFGIPVLEALACGVPSVTSNVSSLPEVAGDAALTVDPYSVPELSSALERLITDDPLRERLTREAVTQAAKFTWTKTAIVTRDAYNDALVRRARS